VNPGATEPTRRYAALGALLGTFVGDALGMPYEGTPATAIPGRIEMAEARLGRGTYTDDTEMMIGLAESLLARGEVDPEDLAARFLQGCEPARGYGAGTLRVLEMWRRGVGVGEAASAAFGGAGSFGNGAAMRIAPVGVLFAADPERLRREAAASAAVTHAHPLGIDGAVVQAAAVGAATRGEEILAGARAAASTDELQAALIDAARLREKRPGPDEVARALGRSSAAHRSVPTAIYAATAHRDFESAVSFAVRCGGDADTIGAMAGAIIGAREGCGGIPRRWLDALEDGPRGRSYVERLAVALAGASRRG
jgi:poly(ADP-ribose) glycohydrolase ARH3